MARPCYFGCLPSHFWYDDVCFCSPLGMIQHFDCQGEVICLTIFVTLGRRANSESIVVLFIWSFHNLSMRIAAPVRKWMFRRRVTIRSRLITALLRTGSLLRRLYGYRASLASRSTNCLPRTQKEKNGSDVYTVS